MNPDDQVARRDAMVRAVEADSRGGRLADLVRHLHRHDGIALDVLMTDLYAILPTVDDSTQEHVHDVMDLIIGLGNPQDRIGPYSWGDSRNVFRQRNDSGEHLAGPDLNEP